MATRILHCACYELLFRASSSLLHVLQCMCVLILCFRSRDLYLYATFPVKKLEKKKFVANSDAGVPWCMNVCIHINDNTSFLKYGHASPIWPLFSRHPHISERLFASPDQSIGAWTQIIQHCALWSVLAFMVMVMVTVTEFYQLL